MSQTYVTLAASDTIQASRTTLNNNTEALRSSFAGTTAPSSPTPVAGQPFLDTDDNKFYIHDSTATARHVFTVSANTPKQQFVYPANDGITVTQTFRLWSTTHAITITRAVLTSDTACATHASNYYTFALQNAGTAGTGSTAVASQTTNSSGGAAITANTTYSLGTITNANIAADEQLILVVTVTGAPTALNTAKLRFIIQFTNQ